MKIYLATPAYDGKTHTQYTMSLALTVNYLTSQGHQVFLDVDSSNTLLVAARNNFVHKFLKSDCTHLLMIDSDLGWNPAEFMEFIKSDKDFLAGIYPSRTVAKTFVYHPSINEDNSFVADGFLIKSTFVPSGFIMLKKEALQKMVKHFKELSYKSKDGLGDEGTLLFNTEIIDGEFCSEDYVFCKRAEEAGLQIWVDPRITFNHAGVVGGLYLLSEVKEFLENLNKK